MTESQVSGVPKARRKRSRIAAARALSSPAKAEKPPAAPPPDAPPDLGTVYLLHFSEPYRHARHYLGWSAPGRLTARLAEHGTKHGARLLRVAAEAGITWQLVRTWPGPRRRERQLKGRGGAARLCPVCREQLHLWPRGVR